MPTAAAATTATVTVTAAAVVAAPNFVVVAAAAATVVVVVVVVVLVVVVVVGGDVLEAEIAAGWLRQRVARECQTRTDSDSSAGGHLHFRRASRLHQRPPWARALASGGCSRDGASGSSGNGAQLRGWRDSSEPSPARLRLGRSRG